MEKHTQAFYLCDDMFWLLILTEDRDIIEDLVFVISNAVFKAEVANLERLSMIYFKFQLVELMYKTHLSAIDVDMKNLFPLHLMFP